MCREYPPCETAVEAEVPESKRFDLLGLIATSALSLFALFSVSATAGGLILAPDVSPHLAELAETGAISQVTELSNRRRLTTFFTNEQSPFYGVQLNYVNVGLGNLTFLNRDLVRADRVPIVFGRVYDSRKTNGADFGPGWKLSVVEFIQVRGRTLLYTDASGSEYELTIEGGQVFSAYPHLTGITDGHVRSDSIELRHGGLQKRFERAEDGYRLIEVREDAGGALRLRYKTGRVERLWTSNQRFVDLIRDPHGRIIAAHDDAGRRTTYEYDAKGRLAVVTDLGGQRWQIGYDARDLLAHVTDPRGAAALQATFDSAGRVQQLRVLYDSMSFEYQSAQTTVLNALQQSAVFWHDASGLTRTAKDFAGELTEIGLDDRLQPVSLSFNGALVAELTYEGNHRLRTVGDRVDAGSQPTTFEYDARGRLLGASKEGTSIKRYGYDSQGRLISATDENGQRTYTYLANRLKSIKVGKTVLELDINDLGQLTRFGSSEQQVVIDYDRQDRVQSLRYAMAGLEAQSRYMYGTQGLRTRGSYSFRTNASAKAPAKRVAAALALSYDAVGNLTGLHETAEGKTLLSQSYLLGDKNQLQRLTTNGRPVDYEYDAAGRVSQIRVDGRVATFEYDALGRLSGAGLNGQQLVTSDYGPMDVDVAAEADGHSAFTAVAAPIASAIFASLDSIAYARPRGTPFGPIRFDATMGRFILAQSLIPAPDAVLLASFKRRALPLGSAGHHDYGKKALTMVNVAPIGFDKPSNGLFLPAEFSSLNCYQCQVTIGPAVMAVNGSSAGTAIVNVGTPVSIETYDPTSQSNCSYQFVINCDPGGGWCDIILLNLPPNLKTAFGDGTSEEGLLPYSPGYGFMHTYSAPGQYTVESAAACLLCTAPQFIQLAAATAQVYPCENPIQDLNHCPKRVSNGTSPSSNGCTAVPENPTFVPPLPPALVAALAPIVDNPISGGPSFTPACNNHDVCFSTCNPAGQRNIAQGKAICDNNFKIDLENICEQPAVTSQPPIYAECTFFRNVYGTVLSEVPPEYFYVPAQRQVCRCCP